MVWFFRSNWIPGSPWNGEGLFRISSFCGGILTLGPWDLETSATRCVETAANWFWLEQFAPHRLQVTLQEISNSYIASEFGSDPQISTWLPRNGVDIYKSWHPRSLRFGASFVDKIIFNMKGKHFLLVEVWDTSNGPTPFGWRAIWSQQKLPKDHKTLVSSNKGSWSKGTDDWRLMNVAGALYGFLVVLTLCQSCTVRYPQGRAHLSPRFKKKHISTACGKNSWLKLGHFLRDERYSKLLRSAEMFRLLLWPWWIYSNISFGDVHINFKRKLLNFWHGFFSLQI